jgi:hypothetical protein
MTARNAMDRQMVLLDWYWRMPLQSGLTEIWLGERDLVQARTEAEKFLQVTQASAERTWLALAWEANARVAIAELDLDRARECLAKSISTMEGFEVPLPAWIVNGSDGGCARDGKVREAASPASAWPLRVAKFIRAGS